MHEIRALSWTLRLGRWTIHREALSPRRIRRSKLVHEMVVQGILERELRGKIGLQKERPSTMKPDLRRLVPNRRRVPKTLAEPALDRPLCRA